MSGALAGLGRTALRVAEAGWLLVALLVLWEIAGHVLRSLFFPPVSRIAAAFARNWLSSDPRSLFVSDLFRQHVVPSLERLSIGYAIAMVAGIGIGIVLGSWKPAGTFFAPVIRFGYSIPAVALLPVALVIFGINNSMNISLIALGCFWPILFNTWDGVRNIDTGWTLAARSLRLHRGRYFRDVVLRAASPSIVTGLRVSLGIGLIAIVVSELYASTEGIGYFLVIGQRLFRIDDMWSSMFMLAILGTILNLTFGLMERVLLRWHTGARLSGEYAAS